MSQTIDLNGLERHIRRIVLQDGLFELFLGIGMLWFGLLFAAGQVALAVVLMVVLMPMFGNRVLERIKERYVYPRIGYVNLRRQTTYDRKTPWLLIGLFCAYLAFLIGSFLLVSSLAGAEIGRTLWYMRFPPAIAGIEFAFGFMLAAYRLKIPRWYVLGCLAIVLGLTVPFIPGLADWHAATGLPLVILGVVTAATGAAIFAQFVRRNPVIEETSDVSN